MTTTNPITPEGAELVERFPLGTRVTVTLDADPELPDGYTGTGTVAGLYEDVYDDGDAESGPHLSVDVALVITPDDGGEALHVHPECDGIEVVSSAAANTHPIPDVVLGHLAEGDRLHDELLDLMARLEAWHRVQRQLVPSDATIQKPARRFTRGDGVPDHPEVLRRDWALGSIVHAGMFDVYLGGDANDLRERIADVRAAAEQGVL